MAAVGKPRRVSCGQRSDFGMCSVRPSRRLAARRARAAGGRAGNFQARLGQRRGQCDPAQGQDRGRRHLRPAGLHLEPAEEAGRRGLSELARRQSARGHAARPVLLREQDRDRGRRPRRTAPAPARSPSSAAAKAPPASRIGPRPRTAGVGFHSFTREFDKDKSYTADDLKLVVQRTQTEVFGVADYLKAVNADPDIAAADAADAGQPR